jgi:hypothetical protein
MNTKSLINSEGRAGVIGGRRGEGEGSKDGIFEQWWWGGRNLQVYAVSQGYSTISRSKKGCDCRGVLIVLLSTLHGGDTCDGMKNFSCGFWLRVDP